MFHKKLYLYHGINHKVDEKNRTFYLDHKVSRNLGSYQIEIHGSTNSNTCKLGIGISCAHESLVEIGQNVTTLFTTTCDY